jgi:hypothetical protein
MRIAALLAVATLLGLSAALPARAEMQCSPTSSGSLRCTVGLRSTSMSAITQTQRASQWCWAAAMSMVLKSHGVDVAQEDIVRRHLGEMADKPIRIADMGSLLNTAWTDGSGRLEVEGGELPRWRAGLRLSAPEVLDELESGRPLIIVGAGHAVVLVQIVFEMLPGQTPRNGGPIHVVRAVVLDPGAPIPLRTARPHEWQPEAAFRVEVRRPTVLANAS